MPSIDKLRHNIRHAVSLSAFSPNLIHRIRYFFLCTVTFRDYSNYIIYGSVEILKYAILHWKKRFILPLHDDFLTPF